MKTPPHDTQSAAAGARRAHGWRAWPAWIGHKATTIWHAIRSPRGRLVTRRVAAAVVVAALAPWITVLYRIMLYGEAFDQMLIWCALFLIWQTRRTVRDWNHTTVTPTGKDNDHEATAHHAENQPAHPTPPRQSRHPVRKRKR